MTLDWISLADAKFKIQFMSENRKYHAKVLMKKFGHTIGKLRTILFRSYEVAPCGNITEAVSFQCGRSHPWMGWIGSFALLGNNFKKELSK